MLVFKKIVVLKNRTTNKHLRKNVGVTPFKIQSHYALRESTFSLSKLFIFKL